MQMHKDILFVLNNLRQEDLLELELIWGNNWKQTFFESVSKIDVLFVFGKDEFGDEVPIAMGGFENIPDKELKIACVWLLSTKYIYSNKICFMKELKKQFQKRELDYDILYNYIYKSNKEAKTWLKKLGFLFDNPKPNNLNVRKDFEFFYKVRKGKKCVFMKQRKQ